MRIAVLGTGVVGRTLAARLDGFGHDVVLGTRDPADTTARTEPGGFGTPPYTAVAGRAPRRATAELRQGRRPGTEMLLALWLRLMGSSGHADFNFHVPHA